jgi:hypothetical protein
MSRYSATTITPPKTIPLNDADGFVLAVSQIAGKRLTYAELTGKVGKTEPFYEEGKVDAPPGTREAEALDFRFFFASMRRFHIAKPDRVRYSLPNQP